MEKGWLAPSTNGVDPSRITSAETPLHVGEAIAVELLLSGAASRSGILALLTMLGAHDPRMPVVMIGGYAVGA